MEGNQRRVRWEEIEKGLGSVGRIRMLREMIERSDEFFTKYALERRTGLKPVDVRSNLEVLLELGWVKEYRYDPRTYKVNAESEAIRLIAEFFHRIPG
ncbi:MAG: hypothetical protein OEZ48_10100 [Candidatus Bathyarchaeota archaeon]|nr:hypothetical protein [Candidatus Bathyarchaeota archaeon]